NTRTVGILEGAAEFLAGLRARSVVVVRPRKRNGRTECIRRSSTSLGAPSFITCLDIGGVLKVSPASPGSGVQLNHQLSNPLWQISASTASAASGATFYARCPRNKSQKFARSMI